MNTSGELLGLATELEGHARALREAAERLSGRPMARAISELERSVAYCIVALRRLAESGIAAWDALDSRFPFDPVDRPPNPSKTPDPFATLGAELDVITCLLTGDMVLEDLAYAELVRREQAPEWTPGKQKTPSMWPKLMKLLDGVPTDQMTEPARYLDVTLAYARDVLVAHRDPTIHYFPSFSNRGQVTLTRAAVDPYREAKAAELVKGLTDEINHRPHGLDSRDLLQRLVSLSSRLDKEQRERLRTAYRYVGFESPPLGDMMRRVSHLLRLYLEGLGRVSAETSSVTRPADDPTAES